MSLLEKSAKEPNISHENSHDIGDNNVISESCSSSNSDSEITDAPINFRRDINEIPTLTTRMLNLCREFAIFCLVMVTLSAFTKDPPKISKPPAAYPFFPEGSIVTDWYRGHISKAIETSRSNDIAFIMFYAPWDAESQAARKEFEATARYMQDYVSFAAVNCWQPQGECRRQYAKVYKWPVLIAYLSHGRGVQYNGPMSAPHMIRFLQKMCHPIVRVSKEKPTEFVDAYVVAEMNTSPGSLDFAVFYTAALNYLERDPQHRLTFYINPVATLEPSLYLHLWNETLMFPTYEQNWTSSAILQWIFKNTKQVTAWVIPPGTKSVALSVNMENNPALILFTPKNPLYSNTDYYNMLQEIGQEYYSCEENVMVNMHSLSIKLKRSANLQLHKDLNMKCKPKPKSYNRKVISNVNSVWANVSMCSQIKSTKDCDALLRKRINYCCSISREPVITKHNSKKCYTPPNYTSMLTGENDPRSPENLLKLHMKDTCKQFLAAEKIQTAIFEMQHVHKKIDISGLYCKSNRSLVLLTMDSLLHYQFAQRLGVDLLKKPDRSAVIIVNDKMESHYIMQEPINSWTLRQFIQNFTKNTLNRSLESLISLNISDMKKSIHNGRSKDNFQIMVEELYTDSFLPVVLQKNKAVIVFYYSKQCFFCSGISHNFLLTAKKLSYVENLLFTRIDGDTNNLPWEYTMETYPTILFFPAYSKSETRVYPSTVPITEPNLIGFILRNIDPNLKLQVMWSICNWTKFSEDKSSCQSSLLGETLSVIARTLREWRKSSKRQKHVLLYNLRQLRQLHLLFAHSSHKHQLIQAYFKKLNSKLGYSEDYYHKTKSEKDNRRKDEL